jgi:hypothetical protein
MEHKEFRATLWDSLFSYLVQVSSERKLAKFYNPSTTATTPYVFQTESPITIQVEQPEQIGQVEGVQEHKWKALGKRVYCYNCRAIYLATKKRKFGDEIPINSIPRKRAGQTQWGCNICDVALCTSGDCWADYHQRTQSS